MSSIDKYLQQRRFRKARAYVDSGYTLLDVGCGDGQFLCDIAGHIKKGIGIDPRARMPKALPENIELVQDTFPEGLKIEKRFDAITFLAVAQYFPHELLGQLPDICSRLLRKNGRVIITTPEPIVAKAVGVLESMGLVSTEQNADSNWRTPLEILGPFLESDGYELIRRSRFELSLNHLLVLKLR